ncbi:NDP-sugar synthase [Bacteroidota bacterium]
MKALILAAGLGTRLKPVTENKPKALVEINGKTLLQITIERLKSFGINDIIVNVHHFAQDVIDYLKINKNFGASISVSDERDLLLDTGGGIKNASWFFDCGSPFIVHNVDIISDIDLKKFYQKHVESKVLVSLAVRKRKSSRYLLFDKNDTLCGWKNVKTGEEIRARIPDGELHQLAYSGIQIMDPAIINYMPEEKVFSVIDLLLNLAPNYLIKAYRHDDDLWMDVGKKENLQEAEKLL